MSELSSKAPRFALYTRVVFEENELGVAAGSIGYVLADYGDGYEVEISNPDGSTSWIGSAPDHLLRGR